MRATLGRLSSVEADERKRVARELHDTVVQDLVALHWTFAELAANPDVGSHTGDLDALSTRLAALTETARGVSFRLESPVSDSRSLETALRAEVVALRSSELAIDLDCRLEQAITRAVAVLAFRTVREALRNVAQHTNTSHATVSLSTRNSELVAVVRDDGCGVALIACRSAAARRSHRRGVDAGQRDRRGRYVCDHTDPVGGHRGEIHARRVRKLVGLK